MENFTAHQLRFTGEVTTPLELNEYKGGALRGALFHTLRRQFCVQRDRRDCRNCPTVEACPIAYLMATVREESWRGAYVPRPYVLAWSADQSAALGGRPRTRYEPGERFAFDLTLFGRAANLFPYVVVGVQQLEHYGMGRKVRENRWRRGTFRIADITAHNPFTAARQAVWDADGTVQAPNIPITNEQVGKWVNGQMDKSANLQMDKSADLSVKFLTPTRITDAGRLVHKPEFRPIFQRLLERLTALTALFSDTPLDLDFSAVVARAEEVEIVHDETRWVELESYSARQGRRTPTSGFVGQVTWRAADWKPFLPFLLWGMVTHVGKDAVKGNGRYCVKREA